MVLHGEQVAQRLFKDPFTLVPGSQCADLVRSRFSTADFAPLHVTGVRVLRAIRVHNRYLRSRFEKRITHILGLQVCCPPSMRPGT